jgi:general stress protein 26
MDRVSQIIEITKDEIGQLATQQIVADFWDGHIERWFQEAYPEPRFCIIEYTINKGDEVIEKDNM